MSAAEREKLSIAIASRLAKYLPFRKAKHIGAYFPTTEEVDTGPIIELCQLLGKQVYMPVINTRRGKKTLTFHEYTPGETSLLKNRFGILEPETQPGGGMEGTRLDLICVPTVAFSGRCDRIGMGGGYYDRAFEKKKIFKPVKLVGIAFDCQRASFDVMAHDVPMDAVVTESGVLVR